jgi:DNA-binding MarR family transcriptional regulator
MSSAYQVLCEATHSVRDACLCLLVHRAARRLARCFDDAFRSLGLTGGQFSILNALNHPEPPNMHQASVLSMDRTTLTAALKPLARRGLVEAAATKDDRRDRRMALTVEGDRTLAAAIGLWRVAHAEVEARLHEADVDHFRDNLRAISAWE